MQFPIKLYKKNLATVLQPFLAEHDFNPDSKGYFCMLRACFVSEQQKKSLYEHIAEHQSSHPTRLLDNQLLPFAHLGWLLAQYPEKYAADLDKRITGALDDDKLVKTVIDQCPLPKLNEKSRQELAQILFPGISSFWKLPVKEFDSLITSCLYSQNRFFYHRIFLILQPRIAINSGSKNQALNEEKYAWYFAATQKARSHLFDLMFKYYPLAEPTLKTQCEDLVDLFKQIDTHILNNADTGAINTTLQNYKTKFSALAEQFAKDYPLLERAEGQSAIEVGVWILGALFGIALMAICTFSLVSLIIFTATMNMPVLVLIILGSLVSFVDLAGLSCLFNCASELVDCAFTFFNNLAHNAYITANTVINDEVGKAQKNIVDEVENSIRSLSFFRRAPNQPEPANDPYAEMSAAETEMAITLD